MIRRRWQAFVLFTCIWFVACATPYQRLGIRGGYDDRRIDEDTFEVIAATNGYSRSGTTQAYFMYHCAELTLASGHDYFVIEDYDEYLLHEKARLPRWTRIRLYQGSAPHDAGTFDARTVKSEFQPFISR